jgi:hypothetical protein
VRRSSQNRSNPFIPPPSEQLVDEMIQTSGALVAGFKATSTDPVCAAFTYQFLFGQAMRVGSSLVLGACPSSAAPSTAASALV